jgi:NTP pyrophosphatase (non-canonical NTP hydrolase)
MNLQKRRWSLLDEFNPGIDPSARALDLSSEVGEVCKEILKSTRYGTRAFQPTPNLEMELGDAFFSLLTLAASVDMDLDAALERPQRKCANGLSELVKLAQVHELTFVPSLWVLRFSHAKHRCDHHRGWTCRTFRRVLYWNA